MSATKENASTDELEQVAMEMGKFLVDFQSNLQGFLFSDAEDASGISVQSPKQIRPSSAPQPLRIKWKNRNKPATVKNTEPEVNVTPKVICKTPTPPSVFFPPSNNHSKRTQKPQPTTQRSRSVSPQKTPLEPLDHLKIIKDTVDTAMRNKKTFTVSGNYQTIRRALQARGWIEKMRLSYHVNDRDNLRQLHAQTNNDLARSVNDRRLGLLYKRVIMSKMLSNHQVDFYWDSIGDAFKVNPDGIKHTLINRFRRGIFSYTSKQGLCESTKKSHWYNKPGVYYLRHPRTYNLTNNGDPSDFIEDFRLTAAMSVLKWVVRTDEEKTTKIVSTSGKVPLTIFKFAMDECVKYIRKCRHEDVDEDIEDALDFDWKQFLDDFYKLVHINNHFKSDSKETEGSLTHKAKFILKKLSRYYPYVEMDGMMNVWILKPTNGSQGHGIHMCRTLQYILKVVKDNKNTRYIIQKYIERPLLIHATKFDIRQWFLISSTTPLTIWMYKECYVRFSSQTYNLRKLHESIHLTNNAVQTKYQNCARDSALPEKNMWDSTQFQQYLATIGYPNVYSDVIYPGMKESILAAVLLNYEYLDTRRNSFELYGSDFMVTEDFKPWLIEINSRPALYASTPVTSRMCPQVLDDLIKVVIDHSKAPKSNTGRFELLYKATPNKLPPLLKELSLEGKAVPKKYFYTLPEVKGTNEPRSADIMHLNDSQFYLKHVGNEMKHTLENLLSIIQKERIRRRKLYAESAENNGLRYQPVKLNTDFGEPKPGPNKREYRKKNMDFKVTQLFKKPSEILKPSDVLLKSSSTHGRFTDPCDKDESYHELVDLGNVQQLENEIKKGKVDIDGVIKQLDQPKCSEKSIFRDLMNIMRNFRFHSKMKQNANN